MSTSGTSYGELPPTEEAAVGLDLANTDHLFAEPTQKVSNKYIAVLVLAQLVFFIALLGPAVIGMTVKVQTLVSDVDAPAAIATVYSLGALAAVIGNVLFGRLSDRTTSRFGRRRPWIVGGTIVMTFAFLLIALAPTIPLVTVGWFLAQFGANAALAPFIATIADQVPKFQRGQVAALLGIAQNVGVLGGVYVAQAFATQLIILFVAPAVLAIGAMLLYAFVLPDQKLTRKPSRMSAREWVQTFWVNPLKYPDFALAWWSRFLITLATFMFTTFRLLFVQSELGISKEAAPGIISTGVLIYTLALVAAGFLAGKISDRTGRRKFLVAGSTLIFAFGTVLLAHVGTVGQFYAVEALLGLAFGIYVGVDLALVVDVLPNPDEAGKDLGVFNIANALPQTLAPIVGAVLLGIASATNSNYDLLLYVAGGAALLGAIVVLPIKKVR
jgi:MFS family permease